MLNSTTFTKVASFKIVSKFSLKLNVIKEKGIVLKKFVTIINESLKIILNRHLIKNNLNQKVFFFCYYLYFTLQK
jgi:hypothetical protein